MTFTRFSFAKFSSLLPGPSLFPGRRGQMSEAFSAMLFLSISGGLQDAYTYVQRGHVFANGQTGNIVLLSQNLFSGNLAGVLRYLFPLMAFAAGVAVTEQIRLCFQNAKRIHWRQLVLLAEILLLFLVGFVPSFLDLLANAIVSFSCAMQIQAFRTVDGCAFSSTMCVGNMRSCVEILYNGFRTKDAALRRKGHLYMGIILAFALGAGAGSACCPVLGQRTIWLSCGLLLVSFCMMFMKEKEEPSYGEPHKESH